MIPRPNSVKRKLAAGGRAIATWCELTDPAVAELLGLAGFDAVIIDNEHGPGDLRDTLVRLQALTATPATAIVRAPWNDAVYLKRILDLGAEGVMVPSVDTPDAARAVIDGCFFPPRGRRGAAYPIVRASGYGVSTDRYRAEGEAELLIICQIESAAAVEAIPDIAAVDGVDMLFIGPMDLSGSIGKLGQFDHPDVRALLNRAERAILDSGRWWGSITLPGRGVGDFLRDGCHFVMPGSDIAFLRDGALAAVRSR